MGSAQWPYSGSRFQSRRTLSEEIEVPFDELASEALKHYWQTLDE